MITYYSTIKLFHFFGIAAWFGAALAVLIIGKMSAEQNQMAQRKVILEIMAKIEIPASFFMPLSGILMMIEQTHWLTVGWMHLKIIIALAALGFTHVSRAKMLKKDDSNPSDLRRFLRSHEIVVLLLIFIIIIVKYN